jgi:hypothetical protein
MPVYHDAQSFLSRIGPQIPEDILGQAVGAGDAADAPIHAWLAKHQAEFDRLRDLLVTHRFVYQVEQNSDTGYQRHNPESSSYYVMLAAEAFLGRALLAFQVGDDRAAIADLSAARALAVDLGDAASLLDKRFSTQARDRTYDIILLILNECRSPSQAEHYVHWMRDDPPVASFSSAFVRERLRYTQLYEAAAVADPRTPGGFVDVDKLEQIQDGYLASIGYLDDRMRTIAASLSADSVIEVVDRYMCAIDALESLTHEHLDRQVDAVFADLATRPEWTLILPYISSYNVGYTLRGVVCSKRARTMAAADVFRFRLDVGRWPVSLGEVRQAYASNTHDPFFDVDFTWKNDATTPCFTWPQIINDSKFVNKIRSHHGIDIDSVSPRFR